MRRFAMLAPLLLPVAALAADARWAVAVLAEWRSFGIRGLFDPGALRRGR